VIDDIGDLYALGAEFLALPRERSRRAGLEGKVIKAGGNTEPTVDARIIVRRYARDALGFQESDELTAPDIEKEVAKPAAFFDRYRVGDDWLEAQNTFVKLAGLVEIERRETDVGKSSMSHGCYSLRSDCRRRPVCGRNARVELLTDLRHLSLANTPPAARLEISWK
jgi:hypothetical protein